MSSEDANRDTTLAWAYHNATKHSEWSIRTSSHYLDWANVPQTLKIYTTLDPIPLPRAFDQTGISALSAIAATPIALADEKIPTLKDLARILYFSAGITKKKTFPWAEIYFRTASCTGALYEFELYVVCCGLKDLPAGVYHFGPGDFALRLLRQGDHRAIFREKAPVVIIGAGTYWRNAWKYGTRTYRHFGWDNGTMLANMLAMTAALQLPAKVVFQFIDSEVNALLDLDTKREVAFSTVTIGHLNAEPQPAPREMPPLNLPTVPLSPSEVDYPEMRKMHEVSSLKELDRDTYRAHVLEAGNPNDPRLDLSADSIEQVILRRGSSRRFERQPIKLDQMKTILYASTRGIPADFPPMNDLYLIVNAVEGLASGAYFYHREIGRAHV